MCGDGSFDVALHVSLDFVTGNTEGTWSVVSGTGSYERLRGKGQIHGERTSTTTIQDEYQGSMHVD